MTHRTACRRACLVLGILASASLAASRPEAAHGHGLVDQSSSDPTARPIAYRCGQRIPALAQAFAASADVLVGFEMVMHIFEPFEPPGLTVYIIVREATPEGAVLGQGSVTIPQASNSGARRVHVDLVRPLRGVRGKSLLLEVLLPLSPWRPIDHTGPIGWRGFDTNPYPGGTAYLCYDPTASKAPGRPPNAWPPEPRPNIDFDFVSLTEDPLVAGVCPRLATRVPARHLEHALAEPSRVRGYGLLEHPGRPPGQGNRLRRWLNLDRPAAGFHPTFNALVFKAGCW